MNSPQQKKSRRSLLLVVSVFALPIILAKLALELNWLDYGVTNKGLLVENELTLENIGLTTADFDNNWLILYVLPYKCDDTCEKTLEVVHNTYVALGREMPRVLPIVLTQSSLSESQQSRVSQSQWQVMALPATARNNIDHSQVLIVDPLGNIVLSHTPPEQEELLMPFGKQILADMKKLLKYSKVG